LEIKGRLQSANIIIFQTLYHTAYNMSVTGYTITNLQYTDRCADLQDGKKDAGTKVLGSNLASDNDLPNANQKVRSTCPEYLAYSRR
jgi:hypothetical protein